MASLADSLTLKPPLMNEEKKLSFARNSQEGKLVSTGRAHILHDGYVSCSGHILTK